MNNRQERKLFSGAILITDPEKAKKVELRDLKSKKKSWIPQQQQGEGIANKKLAELRIQLNQCKQRWQAES